MKSQHKGIYKLSDTTRKSKWCWERRIDGKRKRTFFISLAEAIVCKRKAESEARRTGANLRLMFDGDAQKEYFSAKQIVGNVSLVEAAMFYRENKHLVEVKHLPVEAVVEEVVGIQRDGVTKAHLRRRETALRRFAQAFKGRELPTITQKEIFAWIRTFSTAANTVRERANQIAYLMRRAVTLGYLRDFQPFDKLFFPKALPVPVEVYTAQEVDEILAVALKRCPQFMPTIALRCFVGLRSTEAAKMHWEWIDFERKKILIPAAICKTRDDWVLQSPNLPETVFRWLERVPQEKRTGRIPSPVGRLSVALGVPLKHNGFRHTFCTMHISLYGSADRTATLLKHRGTKMLFRHYLGKLVSQKEAQEYFALTPPSAAQ